MLLFLLLIDIEATDPEKFNVTLSPNVTNKGSIIVDWSSYDCNDKIFKVYRSRDNINFETISLDYTQVKQIKCLQVYPKESIKNQLKDWMKDYGKNIIDVSSVSIEEFNLKPENYLTQYDVILFGTNDGNGWKDLNENAVQPLKDYIKSLNIKQMLICFIIKLFRI